MLTFNALRRGDPGPSISFEDRAVEHGPGGVRALLLGRDSPGTPGALAVRSRTVPWLVTRKHAYVTRDRHHQFFVYDVSRAGTYLNDVRVPLRSPVQLADGDVISLGAPRLFLLEGQVMANPHALAFRRLVAPRAALARGRRGPRSPAREQSDRDAMLRAVSCTVCREPLCDARTLACGHVFCLSCAGTWLATNESCPTCRAAAVMEDLRPVVGLDDLADAVVRAHGSREDIAALALRRVHRRLPGDAPAPHGRRGGPTMLTPEAADATTVLLRAHVGGATQYFVAHRRAIESV